MAESSGSQSISPTAHYTAEVWARAGLSHPALTTREGWVLFNATRPLQFASSALGGPTLEGFLLARHGVIDFLLGEAIDSGRVTQVVEIAAGMSPRGWRFADRYGERITYVEADLPGMAERKRRALADAGLLNDRHRVVELDALASSGPLSVAELAGTLDLTQGVAVITEGLLNYLDRDSVEGLWRNVAGELVVPSGGLYLSDLHVGEDQAHGTIAKAFGVSLAIFVRGRIHMHYRDAGEAVAALKAAGFGEGTLHQPSEFADRVEGCERPGSELVRVVEAA